jgi:hypothetical protein
MPKTSPRYAFLKRALFGALCLCFFLSSSFATPGRAKAAPVGVETADITIVNHSDYAIPHLLLSPIDHEAWGPDQLKHHVIHPGESFVLHSIPCDAFDIKLVDEDGDTCIVHNYVFCHDSHDWVVTNETFAGATGWTRDGGR